MLHSVCQNTSKIQIL
ncbi:hypothetical protein ZEAMMB73_Zm00001d031989 [Zea mays]|uniref:Uncharacterized protein n=1 Tax=Zea mays TaxID=4577 RepID=A0A1D6KMW2_MAIZE|nr:hypothetical protein ZEAMMB73_Zm00001d031989 [Zea mays]